MKRLDDGKTSLVDFLSSIKFGRRRGKHRYDIPAHFAQLHPQARPAGPHNAEDRFLVRSAN